MDPLFTSSEAPLGPGQPSNHSAAASANGHAPKPCSQPGENEAPDDLGYVGDEPSSKEQDDDQPSAEELAGQEKLKSPRPYFISEDFLRGLPSAAQTAMFVIVVPCYEELVLGAATALERQAGTSLTFILFLELLDQFALGKLAETTALGGSWNDDDREKQVSRYLRLVHSKQHVANFLLRMKMVTSQSPAPIPSF